MASPAQLEARRRSDSRESQAAGRPVRLRNCPFVSVAVRVQPNFSDEPVAIWAKQTPEGELQRRVCCHRGYILEEYEFSRVFGPEDSNSRLFHDLQGPALTSSVFNGVNETLFAYGQTGSGKTHTIFGTRQDAGLLQLFVRRIFDQAELSPGSTVHACCYEVLGDSLTDLVDSQAKIARGLLQAEDVVYDELFIKTQRCRYQIVRVGCMETCLSLLQDAAVRRTAGISSCNMNSSRSHAVVHLFVQNPASEVSDGGMIPSSIGALTLVDLAGTEKEHENPSERGRKSARLLNTSLSSLNRLLRKLQTGSLDESERRQSVLNKCLWEYLRPGCGIALIFCASPLLRHRTMTLSTLAMATDSKLIHSQRKSQFIHIPSPYPHGGPVPQPQFSPAASPRSSQADGRYQAGWASPPPMPKAHGDRTPRQNSQGRTTPTSSCKGKGRGADFCLTPQGNNPEISSPFKALSSQESRYRRAHDYGAPQEPEFELNSVADLEQFCGYNSQSPAALQSLVLQNEKLKRKLTKTRARSQERLGREGREKEQLGADNAALQRECELLRALFIRQQQQQIAFWTGPFMEMIAPQDGLSCGGRSPASAAAAAAAGFAQAAVRAAEGEGEVDERSEAEEICPEAEESQETIAPDGGRKKGGSALAKADARFVPVSAATSSTSLSSRAQTTPRERATSPCSIRQERDYWRNIAMTMQRELTPTKSLGGESKRSATPMSAGLQAQEESELSTSQSQHGHLSERSRSRWSDSSSEP
mmetsp:Transcript_72950/g.117615  ORF Transcript_72950/g.117615 Transcript_72950/m.117615 type:complete len:759 (-) Transcript_72950:51-2327(-)